MECSAVIIKRDLIGWVYSYWRRLRGDLIMVYIEGLCRLGRQLKSLCKGVGVWNSKSWCKVKGEKCQRDLRGMFFSLCMLVYELKRQRKYLDRKVEGHRFTAGKRDSCSMDELCQTAHFCAVLYDSFDYDSSTTLHIWLLNLSTICIEQGKRVILNPLLNRYLHMCTFKHIGFAYELALRSCKTREHEVKCNILINQIKTFFRGNSQR